MNGRSRAVRRRRRRRVVTVALLILAGLLLAGCLANTYWAVYWCATGKVVLTFSHGSLYVVGGALPAAAGEPRRILGIVEVTAYSPRWWTVTSSLGPAGPPSEVAVVPVWAGLPVLAGVAAWMGRVDYRATKRRRAGLCGECGYDLAGLGAAAAVGGRQCPECGCVENG